MISIYYFAAKTIRTMPKLSDLLQLIRSWRIDEEDPIPISPSTPIITVLPSVEEPGKTKNENALEKTQNEEEIKHKNNTMASICYRVGTPTNDPVECVDTTS